MLLIMECFCKDAEQDVEGARTLLRKGAFSGLRDCVK